MPLVSSAAASSFARGEASPADDEEAVRSLWSISLLGSSQLRTGTPFSPASLVGVIGVWTSSVASGIDAEMLLRGGVARSAEFNVRCVTSEAASSSVIVVYTTLVSQYC